MEKEFKKVENEVVNPYTEGVTYKDLIDAMGKLSVKEYLKDTLTKEEIEFIEQELINYKNNNKK